METLREEDIEKIADRIAEKTRAAFHIDEEVHYNSHQKLDRLLDAYNTATNVFTKTFFAFVVVGLIVLAGVTAMKGWK